MTRALRDIFGRFPTGVAIVTTRTAEGPVGVTISSFNSVSLDPAMAVFSLTRTLRSTPAFEDQTDYGLSFLAEDQDGISTRFSRAGTDKWDGTALLERPGAPLIAGATAWLSLRRSRLIEAGDHLMFLCDITDFTQGTGKLPLVFCTGRYQRLAA